MSKWHLSWVNGTESALIIGLIGILLTVGCGGAPSSPDTNGLSGKWDGQFRQLACTSTQIDTRPCAFYQTGVLKLELTGGDGAASGRLTVAGFEYPDAPIWNTPVTLNGTVDGNRVSLMAVVNSTAGFSDRTTTFSFEGEMTASKSMNVTFSVRDRSAASGWRFEREAEGWLRR